jgi:phenylacetyl-CoA:acceptor oxidoreductase 26-kDa subunit
LLFVLGISGIVFQQKSAVYAAALAALAFLYCQARILRAAKGIPVWRAPQVVPLIVSTGLAEGLGLALFFDSGIPLLSAFALAVAARAFAWTRYRAAVKAPMLEPAGRTLVLLGTLVAVALAAAAWAVPALAPLAGLAGLAAAVSGWRLKLALVTRAAFKQEFSLAHLPVRGTR